MNDFIMYFTSINTPTMRDITFCKQNRDDGKNVHGAVNNFNIIPLCDENKTSNEQDFIHGLL